ncbi:MAG: hypothetical protein ACI9WU_004832 [Myxococcota bacterium]|jgi:hypothetical protein
MDEDQHALALLKETGERCQTLAREWTTRLTETDRDHLSEAFYTAESLAHSAIIQAMAQVPETYRAELQSQLEDEERHIAVFRRWLGDEPEPFGTPPERARPNEVWFASLLVNEIAGFCQFHMLAGLCGDPGRKSEVLAIADDEIIHVQRLLRWLAPSRDTRAWLVVEAMVNRFLRRLDNRMAQFLPAEPLTPLREEMARLTAALLTQLALQPPRAQ